MAQKKQTTKMIAPRLANGESRAKVYNAWPPAVKLALQTIAAKDGISLNYMLEQAVMERFRIRRPKYQSPARVLKMRRSA